MEQKLKENLINQFKKVCRDNNLKITPQRTIIYEELIKSCDHPSVDALYKRVRDKLPDVSFDTVYRSLITFGELGVADVIEGVCSTKRYEGNTKPHYHFVCTKCGSITDIFDIDFDFKIPEVIQKKYAPKSTRVIFDGICESCKN